MLDFQGLLFEIQAVLASSDYPHDDVLPVFSLGKYFLRQQNKRGGYIVICSFCVCHTIFEVLLQQISKRNNFTHSQCNFCSQNE